MRLATLVADREREANTSVSPLCNRGGEKESFYDGQSGFLRYLVEPLFEVLASTLRELGKSNVEAINANYACWVAKAEAERQEKIKQSVIASAER